MAGTRGSRRRLRLARHPVVIDEERREGEALVADALAERLRGRDG